MTDSLEQTIAAMRAEMDLGPDVYRPSRFWMEFGELNTQQLVEAGFDEFKRTINQNYFAFLPGSPRHVQYRAVLREWFRHVTPHVFTARLDDEGLVQRFRGQRFNFWATRRVTYGLYVALLHELTRRHDHLGLLETLDEPALGHPLAVLYRGRVISEDLCNSVLELNAVTLDGTLPLPATVLELGGGYGRFAWAYLRAKPDGRYVGVDIPPALAVAQEYLTRLFPELPTFRFRHLESKDVRTEFDAARLAFLTPNQLELLDPIDADAFVNISSLQEMRHDQIARYMELAERHTRERVYLKEMKHSVNEADGIVIERGDYPIPSQWRRLLARTPYVQREFFEEVYELPRR